MESRFGAVRGTPLTKVYSGGSGTGSITMRNNGWVMSIRHLTATHGAVLKVDQASSIAAFIITLNVPCN